jgi:2,3-bisphosphoglycerate-independent phosphoglycerate mutase
VRYLVLIGDGMADFPVDALDGRTPLEAAVTPAMDEAAQKGLCGLFCPIPPDLAPGSDIGNLSLFGYDPHAAYTGRAPLEAATKGITLSNSEVAFRCNLVTLADGVMASFTSGHITNAHAAELIGSLSEGFSGYPVSFHVGVSYRHLTIVSGGDVTPDDLAAATACTPPHDISDQPYEPHLPTGPGGEFLRDLMERSRGILDGHPVNAARIAAGDLPATSIWLWGQGRAPAMATYQDRFGVTGAVISAVDLVKGIGVCAGLEVIDVPGATGYVDTDYEGKVAAALDALARVEFVYLHVEAPDEASHEGKVDLKIRAIEDFDRRVVAPCLRYASEAGDVRILIAPDHVTALSTKTHAGGPVPFAMYGHGVESNGGAAYSESAARATGLHVEAGHTVVPSMMGAAEIGPQSFDN